MNEQIPEPLLKWWEGFRPIKWDIKQHLNNPAVNCTTKAEKELAVYVSEKIKQK